ncbi:hypothetical protein JZ751_008173 [Albula glossodonta]|uniref:Uncharacterized protein n=1 Tax=Albula glossodonta TaxID=121402 RepID=A0A8T2MTU0_9TELE|nr:hypothetical protein JZ751_008173 [Albula glossodonta]
MGSSFSLLRRVTSLDEKKDTRLKRKQFSLLTVSFGLVYADQCEMIRFLSILSFLQVSSVRLRLFRWVENLGTVKGISRTLKGPSLREAHTSTLKALMSRSRSPTQAACSSSGWSIIESAILSAAQMVDIADAQVVAGADVARLQLQGPGVGLQRLLTAAPIGQRGPQPVPQKLGAIFEEESNNGSDPDSFPHKEDTSSGLVTN